MNNCLEWCLRELKTEYGIGIFSRITILSKRWHEMLGYELGDIETDGRSIGQLVHPSDLANLELAMDHHFSKKSNRYECEYRIKNLMVNIFGFSVGKVVRWSNDGKPMRIVGANTDITAKRSKKIIVGGKKSQKKRAMLKIGFSKYVT